MSNPTLETKGGINWRVRYDSTISAADVVNYLVNDVFKFPIDASLRTIHGTNKGYVVTVICIAEDYIVSRKTPRNYADVVMHKWNANVPLKKDIVDLIKPFMFPTPEQFAFTMRDPIRAQELYDLGIWGSNLEDINKFSSFRYAEKLGYYVIYVDTEKIIRQMVEHPLSNKIEGEFAINTVYGEVDSEIRWDISVKTGGGVSYNSSPVNLTIDRIIAAAR